ncbi:MAG TPA: SMC-Scp complex subunit ScpB [bacterium]|nr:SMC-Scp complex subunit ScpB [bacterium]
MNDLNENLDNKNIDNSEEDSDNVIAEKVIDEKEDKTKIIDPEETSEENINDIKNKANEIVSTEISNESLAIGIKEEDRSNETEESEKTEEERLNDQIRDFHRNQIEAALYASGKPLTIEVLSTKLEIGKKEVEELINELAFDYLDRSTALVISQIGDRYQMQIKQEYTEKISKFAEGGAIAEKYLRTLTIIALKQPILKSLVIKLRGSGAYDHIKYLVDNGLIDAVKKGRSQELTTSEKYAEMFGLPKNREEMKRKMIAQLGLEEEPDEENLGGTDKDLISEEPNDVEEISEANDNTNLLKE